MALFDVYLIVDWSAASTPRRGKDSIWYCRVERAGGGHRASAPVNPPTRFEALRGLAALLHDAVARRRRVLIGFDFPNAYPRGFAAAAGFHDEAGAIAPWRAVWNGLYDHVADRDDNTNSRFRLAAELNRRISGRAFPFWGCPASRQEPLLGQKKPGGYGHAGALAERRLVEEWVRSAQPCWKLFTTGSVGSQALLGIPVAKMLRDDPEIAGASLVWPFETGLRVPDADGAWRVIHAEVYPSLVPLPPLAGRVKDAVQVETVARLFADLDRRGELAPHFAGPPALTAAQRRVIEREEGWILGAGTLNA